MSTPALLYPSRRHRAQGGFSLIEVLIGLLIAMIGVVIMMEVLITSEARTRTTSSGNDAMSGGAVMMHLLQRDLLQAGYGINAPKLLGCTLTLPAAGAVPARTVPIAPVTIYPAGSTSTVVAPQTVAAEKNTTDRLLVMYSSDSGQPEGNMIVAPPAGDVYSMQSTLSFNKGDWVVATTDICNTALILTQIADKSDTTVTVTSGTGLLGATTLFNLGPAPKVVAYAIRNGALTSCDYMTADCTSASAANWTSVGGNIISLRAQYGRDTDGGAVMVADTWDQTTPADTCGWQRVTAVRYALVSKSTQYETALDASGQRTCEAVTASQAPAWSGGAGAAIDLSRGGTVSDWACYRYRTFENIAPSRNLVWTGGCP